MEDQGQPAVSIAERLRASAATALAATGDFVEHILLLPYILLPLWRSFRWGLRMTWHYIKLVCGPSACVYIAVAGMIIGFVAQDFIFRYLPFRQFTEPLLIENLLHATGFSLFRFLVPILCTILIAARSGAATAADVGSKVYGNQVDAMKTIGMSPERTIRTPISVCVPDWYAVSHVPRLRRGKLHQCRRIPDHACQRRHCFLGRSFPQGTASSPFAVLQRHRLAVAKAADLRSWNSNYFMAMRLEAEGISVCDQRRRDSNYPVVNAVHADGALCLLVLRIQSPAVASRWALGVASPNTEKQHQELSLSQRLRTEQSMSGCASSPTFSSLW